MKPRVAPTTWRRLAVKPYRAPVPRATRLTGPGEMDMARANPAMDNSRLNSMDDARSIEGSPSLPGPGGPILKKIAIPWMPPPLHT